MLPQEVADGLGILADLRYTHWNGQRRRHPGRRGSGLPEHPQGQPVGGAERQEIESHVTHTFRFLQQIPWTRDLVGVPEIAFAHHERLNGRGYPRQLSDPEIPIQSKAMAISDVFDALTAQDRPYKAAVPLERSLAILEEDAQAGHLDQEPAGPVRRGQGLRAHRAAGPESRLGTGGRGPEAVG